MIDFEVEGRAQSRPRIPEAPETPTGEQPEDGPIPQTEPGIPWQTWGDRSVVTFGVIVPLIAATGCGVFFLEPICRLIMRHPVETLAECAFTIYMPIANYITLSAMRQRDSRHPIRLGLINGVAIGTAFLIAAIAMVSLFLGYPTVDQFGAPHILGFAVLAMVALLSLSTSVYLADRLRRNKMTRGARLRTVLYSLLGVLVSLGALAGSEARSACIRFAEHLATSETASERESGLQILCALSPEKDLRMDCADARTAGLPGLFFRFDDATARQLYFAATGKPYKDSEKADITTQPDEYLRRHVVGAPIPGLSLIRSAMNGSVNPDTLSSTINWTFVFKNRTFSPQEARAEIAVPPGAVVSGMTLWMNGEPKRASFGASDKVKAAYNWIVVNHRDPALVTDLGRGRVLLQAYPVPAQSEMKVRISMTAPLKMDDPSEATLNLPRFIDNNFSVSGDHTLRLHSSQDLALNLNKVKKVKSDGEQMLIGSFKDDDLSGSGLSVRVQRAGSLGAIAAMDSHSGGKSYIVQTIKQAPAFVPNHLVVVIDGSQAMSSRVKEEVTQALSRLPKSIPTALVIASDEQGNQLEPLPLDEGLKKINAMHFTGGHDNLQAVIKAAEDAGDTRGGAVLWIHGAQPGFNQEIYIMSPYSAAPTFYDLDVENGGTNLNEFFKNHREIGPFIPVSRNSSVGHDLERLIAKWQPNGKDYLVQFARTAEKPSCKVTSADQSAELATLWANAQCKQLIAYGDTVKAAELAVRYGLVTPVSSAVVLETSSDYQRFGLTENSQAEVSNPPQQQTSQDPLSQSVSAAFGSVTGQMNKLAAAPPDASLPRTTPITGSQTDTVMSGQSPMLQGVTNGAIVPQAGDANVVQGFNTAGSVRVNNLANLEALLNIIANGIELLALAFGLVHVVMGFLQRNLQILLPGSIFPVKIGPIGRIALGLAIMCIGLAVPGCINWLVASARDANLFS